MTADMETDSMADEVIQAAETVMTVPVLTGTELREAPTCPPRVIPP